MLNSGKNQLAIGRNSQQEKPSPRDNKPDNHSNHVRLKYAAYTNSQIVFFPRLAAIEHFIN